MALFGNKKEEQKNEETPVVVSEKVSATPRIAGHEDLARVIVRPRITEKATIGIDNGVYVFDVAPDANKKQIKEAVKLAYNVEPVKVRVVTVVRKEKRNQRTGKKGMTTGGKKAYVYLKKGDSISIM